MEDKYVESKDEYIKQYEEASLLEQAEILCEIADDDLCVIEAMILEIIRLRKITGVSG